MARVPASEGAKQVGGLEGGATVTGVAGIRGGRGSRRPPPTGASVGFASSPGE